MVLLVGCWVCFDIFGFIFDYLWRIEVLSQAQWGDDGKIQ